MAAAAALFLCTAIGECAHRSSAFTMLDADFEQIRKLQTERNVASAAKKGSRSFDPATQRGDSSTKAKLGEAWDKELYERHAAGSWPLSSIWVQSAALDDIIWTPSLPPYRLAPEGWVASTATKQHETFIGDDDFRPR
ncbi:hypothetical protein B0H63DRAFT_443710 [Podospora didyma]|uniref:Uncharacterized protein n=1 Tax=Podospora didyma TaxID=330526 RepID=A0AAE0P575_9PEZI|nr:hypothetical protein B0H63DRAFT_443710 [Podospora didyma]